MDRRTVYGGRNFDRRDLADRLYSRFTVCQLFFRGAVFILVFFSYKNRYQAYKAEPNLKITAYFWIELAIHGFFIVAATVQSALNVWLSINEEGMTYRHEYFFVTLMIVILHLVYFCIDYYVTEKVAIVKSCKRMRKRK